MALVSGRMGKPPVACEAAGEQSLYAGPTRVLARAALTARGQYVAAIVQRHLVPILIAVRALSGLLTDVVCHLIKSPPVA